MRTQADIPKRLFEVAEIAKFSEKERKEYEKSLKVYRDIKNVVDTARTESKMEGRIEGKIEDKIVKKEWCFYKPNYGINGAIKSGN